MTTDVNPGTDARAVSPGRNIVANLIGGAWIAALALVVTPVQVNILGIEAFGLVGFIATLQLVLSVFDLGLSTTITREVARDHSAGGRQSLPLVRTAATAYWAIAIVLMVVMIIIAPSIAHGWFRPERLSADTIENGLQVIALLLGLRWPVAFYTGVISGLQRMDMLNVGRVTSVTLRLAGGIVVVLIWRDLQGLLWWMALSAALEVAIYAAVTHRLRPVIGFRPFFSYAAFREIWSFALSMNVLAIVALIVVQMDRLVISKMLPLEQLGYYTVAYNAVSGISLVLTAVASAMLPAFASAHAAGDAALLGGRYRKSVHTLVYLVGALAFPLAFFGEPILSLWVNAQTAHEAWQTLCILAFAFWFSATYMNAYNLLIASGHTSSALWISLSSSVPYIVVVIVLIGRLGIVGAALSWLALTVFYAIMFQMAARRVIVDLSFAKLVGGGILASLATGVVCFGGARLVSESVPSGSAMPTQIGLLVAGTAAYVLIGYVLIGSDLRSAVHALFRRGLAAGAR